MDSGGDPIDWTEDQLRMLVRDVSEVDQVAELRRRAPIELVVPETL